MRPLITTLVCVGTLACGGNRVPEDVIDRDVFVQTYVDLRVAALATDSQKIAVTERDEILARHGITAADLTRFAEAYAEDLDFMRDVWNDIELELDQDPEAN